MNLFLNASTKYLAGLLMVGALLFLPAGTWNFPGGWRFIGLPFIPMLLLGIVLFLKAPALLAGRIKNEEAVLEAGLQGYKEYKQKVKFRMIPFIW